MVDIKFYWIYSVIILIIYYIMFLKFYN